MFKFRWIWSKWPCPSCGSVLTLDGRRHTLKALFFGVWFVFYCIFLYPYLPFWVGLIVLLVGGMLTDMLEGVRLVEQPPPGGAKGYRSGDFAPITREEVLRRPQGWL